MTIKAHHASFMASGAVFVLLFGVIVVAASNPKAPAGQGPQLIEPAELAELLQAPGSAKPLILQVGFRILYEEAHIPGAEYVGAASEAQGQRQLHKRVERLPRNRFIVLYCGCCPWSHCPNVGPAYKELQAMGFRNVKLLHIATNFGADWVDKGYPVSKGK